VETLQVCGTWLRPNFTQDRIIMGLVLSLVDLAVLVIDVTKNDGMGWAGSLACCYHFTVLDGTPFFFRLDTSFVDALHAVGAFFHYTARTDGYFGVAQQSQGRDIFLDVLEEVESPDLIRTVIGAVAGSQCSGYKPSR
jgi:hypothetical protein